MAVPKCQWLGLASQGRAYHNIVNSVLSISFNSVVLKVTLIIEKLFVLNSFMEYCCAEARLIRLAAELTVSTIFTAKQCTLSNCRTELG